MIKLKIILKSKKLIIILILLAILRIFFYQVNKPQSIYSKDKTEFLCTVINKTKTNNIMLDCNEILEGKIENTDNIEIGDIIKIEGILKEYDEQRNFNLFDYKQYQANKNIFYKIDIIKYEKVGKTKNIILLVKNIILKRIYNLKNYNYLKALILGDKKEIDKSQLEVFERIGIIHLFSISGMHISFIVEFIDKFFQKNSNKKNLFIILFLLLYYLLIKSISLFRCIVFYVIRKINDILDLKIDNKKIILISILTIIILKPNFIKEIGFYYSVIISAGISLVNEKINKINNKLIKSLFISIIAFFLSFPLNLYTNYEVNLLSIIYNLVFIPYVSLLVFPFCIFTLFFPFLDNILYILINLLERIANICKLIDISLIFIKPKLILIVIYYLIIFFTLYNKKFIYLFLILVFFHYNFNNIFKQNYILMLDVGQGDSILIHSGSKNVLVDTGGNINGYNISENITIPVLKSLGIKKIDLLILSHGDYDHIGESINLVNNYYIEKVIFNNDNFNDLELNLINILKKKKIKYYQNIKEFKMNDIKFKFLNSNIYDNENDNSNIVYITYKSHNMLFMGDASKIVETDLLKKYKLENIEILKVGHHGSKTSSSKNFVDKIHPKYSIISVGEKNIYGHPSIETLQNLKFSKIFRTDKNGSIMINLKNNFINIKTCL